jgi:hypothetical protein
MVWPLNRAAMKERNLLDERDAAEQVRERPRGDGLRQTLELSDFARARAEACGADWVRSPPDDLADKARRYPVRVLR